MRMTAPGFGASGLVATACRAQAVRSQYAGVDLTSIGLLLLLLLLLLPISCLLLFLHRSCRRMQMLHVLQYRR